MCEKQNDLGEAQAAFQVVMNARDARKAFNFIDRYKAANGRRPSLSSIVMLWQQAQDKLAETEAKLAQAEGDLAQAEQDLTEARAESFKP